MDASFFSTLWLTAQLAAATTLILLLLGLPLAYGLSRWRSRWQPLVEAIISLPLVLPPTVLGFYLLLAFSPEYGLGAWLDRHFALRLVFSFPGLLLGSVIYSLPFMVQPLQAGFRQLLPAWREAALTLGKRPFFIFWAILLPNIRPALLTATVLTFAHTVGEFGVVLMIGGNIPGRTRVASIAIYDAVESLAYSTAHQYALILTGFALVALLLVYRFRSRIGYNPW